MKTVMLVIAVCLVVFAVLCIAEFGWRRGWLKNEIGRKFVHIIVGSFVAFWPLFLTWNQIILLSFAFAAVVMVSKRLKIFRAIHSVQRPTYGELFFAVTVGALALVTHDGWIYMAALLHMSLADGFAAIIGIRYGKSSRYKVLGHTKSIIGTLTFFILSVLILDAYSVGTSHIEPPMIGLIALGATMLENVSAKGTDNITVPIWIAVALSFVV